MPFGLAPITCYKNCFMLFCNCAVVCHFYFDSVQYKDSDYADKLRKEQSHRLAMRRFACLCCFVSVILVISDSSCPFLYGLFLIYLRYLSRLC